MNFVTEVYYQELVDYQRCRHIDGGLGWPGKPVHSSAQTLYPNILAELSASNYWLNTMAGFAGVSPEIMAAVIEDKEELEFCELLLLSIRFEKRGIGYLSSPVLQIVDPSMNKGKRRRRELHDLLEMAAALPDPVTDAHGLHIYWRDDSAPVYEILAAGTPVTFADYRWACFRVKAALRAEASKNKHIRTERRTTA